MPIRHSIDDTREVLEITMSGPVTGREFSAFALDLYGNRSELFDYECVLDLLDYEGSVEYSDLNALQQAYERAPERSTARQGAIITRDPNFRFWAAVLDAQFPGRKHFVVGSRSEAFARLAELRTANSAGM